MARRRRKKADAKDVAGRIITLFFVLLLIGGAYYLYTLFKPVDITTVNMAGTWKLKGTPNTFYTFNSDGADDVSGTASSYTQMDGSIEINNEMKYTYTLTQKENDTERYDLQLQPLNIRGHKDGDPINIEVTGLSNAQMYVKINRSVNTTLTKVNLF